MGGVLVEVVVLLVVAVAGTIEYFFFSFFISYSFTIIDYKLIMMFICVPGTDFVENNNNNFQALLNLIYPKQKN